MSLVPNFFEIDTHLRDLCLSVPNFVKIKQFFIPTIKKLWDSLYVIPYIYSGFW